MLQDAALIQCFSTHCTPQAHSVHLSSLVLCLFVQLMSQQGFLQALVAYPKDSINEEMVELLSAYQDMEDYTLETARKVCGDVAGLLSWTKSMVTFYGINKEVLPLKVTVHIFVGCL